MPSVSLAFLRRTLVVLVVLGALFGAAPGVQACEGRTVAGTAEAPVPEPSGEGLPDAADAVLPVQPGHLARPVRPAPTDARRPEPVPPLTAPTPDVRQPLTATGIRCVVLRC